MKIRSLMVLAAATLVSMSVHAHDCSGGPAGGMDATGNECNAGVMAVASNEGVSTAVLPAGLSSHAPSAGAPARHPGATVAMSTSGAHKAKVPVHHSSVKHTVHG